MTSSPHLALAYIARSPESASRVLSSMLPEASAAFIEEIPILHAVKLIAHLQPATAAKIMQVVDVDVAAPVMRGLDFAISSAIVRQMDRSTRTRFLAKMPKRIRVALEKSLAFAPGTVGAHMTTTIAALSETDSVASAIDSIRKSDRSLVDVVFVLNDARNLVGAVTSAAALRHSEEAQLSAVLDTSCPRLSAHSKIETVTDPALWHDYACLPVVNRQHEVIGAISRKVLMRARLTDAAQAKEANHSVAASVFAALSVTSTGLLSLVAASLTGPALKGDRNEH